MFFFLNPKYNAGAAEAKSWFLQIHHIAGWHIGEKNEPATTMSRDYYYRQFPQRASFSGSCTTRHRDEGGRGGVWLWLDGLGWLDRARAPAPRRQADRGRRNTNEEASVRGNRWQLPTMRRSTLRRYDGATWSLLVMGDARFGSIYGRCPATMASVGLFFDAPLSY